MAKKNYDVISQGMLAGVGGPDNINQVYHCITRMRFSLKDPDKVDLDALSKIPGTDGARSSGGEVQVFIGPDVQKSYDNFLTYYAPAQSHRPTSQPGPVGKKSVMDRIAGFFGAIFLPILPALVGGGMIKSITVLLTMLGWLDGASGWGQALNVMGDATFYFLPFLLAWSSAKFFNVNIALAIVMAGALMYPTIMNGTADGAHELSLWGVTVPLQSYASSVIPIILAVYLMKWVYKLFEKVVPSAITIILVPALTLLVTVPLVLAFLAPLGSHISGVLAQAITWLFETSGALASAVFGALIPLIVMFGMHSALAPLMIQNISEVGYDYLLPLFFYQTLAMSAAALAVFLKTRNTELKGASLSTGITAFLGVTEPAMYGVNIPLKRPFFAALAGAGAGGLVGYLVGVKAYVYAMPSVLSIPTYINPENGSTLVGVLIAAATAFFTAFIITLVWWHSGSRDEAKAATTSGTEETTLYSPLRDGVAVNIAGVSDPTFADQLLGPSSAFVPSDGTIISPINGTVMLVADTAHAVGLRADDGTEILLHVGIDTVKLGGTPFAVKVAVGDTVTVGQELLVVDLAELDEKGVDPTVILGITNARGREKRDLVTPGTPVSAGTAIAAVAAAATTIEKVSN